MQSMSVLLTIDSQTPLAPSSPFPFTPEKNTRRVHK